MDSPPPLAQQAISNNVRIIDLNIKAFKVLSWDKHFLDSHFHIYSKINKNNKKINEMYSYHIHTSRNGKLTSWVKKVSRTENVLSDIFNEYLFSL